MPEIKHHPIYGLIAVISMELTAGYWIFQMWLNEDKARAACFYLLSGCAFLMGFFLSFLP